jgi:5-methylcytosine-specific restriction endonuclease McrA
MGEWSAQYGPEWEATKRRYWSRSGWWIRRRCFWCRRARPGRSSWSARGMLQLNHLTYLFGVGNAPLWVLRPMCPTCHKIETWVTRKIRPALGRSTGWRFRWAHAFVTFGVRWLLYVPVIVFGLWISVKVGAL